MWNFNNIKRNILHVLICKWSVPANFYNEKEILSYNIIRDYNMRKLLFIPNSKLISKSYEKWRKYILGFRKDTQSDQYRTLVTQKKTVQYDTDFTS